MMSHYSKLYRSINSITNVGQTLSPMVTSRHHRQTQLAEQLGRIVAYIELNLLVHGSQVVIAAQVDSLDNLSKIC